MNESQKPTTELYRLMYDIAFNRNLTPDEIREAKLKVNELRGFNFFKEVTNGPK